jgi:acetoacetyl-CoA synthase
MTISIVGTGSHLPAEVVDNETVAQEAGVTSEWINRKTGIRQRHRVAEQEATSDLAVAASRRALEQAGLDPERLAYIVVATSTPDHQMPATANIVQHLLGAANAAAFDVNAVCSGFVYALAVTERMLRAHGAGAYGLAIGADVYSRIMDRTDRKTSVLFGDGAGAVVLGPAPPGHGLLETALLSHGSQHRLITVPAGGSRMPASKDTVRDGAHFLRMDGAGVRSFVQENLPVAVRNLLERGGVPAEDVDHFIPHQANGVLLADVWPGLGLRSATFHLTVQQYGNTGAASIPITLDMAHRKGLLRAGELVLLAGFGGGMSLGLSLLRWAGREHRSLPTPGAAR